MYSCQFLQFSDNSVLLCIWEWSVSPLVIVSRANFTAKSFNTFMWSFCSSFIHIMMLSMMLWNPFEKHFSVARPVLVTEKSISYCQVVCFPATILVPLEIVHLLVTCSGMILPFYLWNLFFRRNQDCNQTGITAWIVDDKRPIRSASSKLPSLLPRFQNTLQVLWFIGHS